MALGLAALGFWLFLAVLATAIAWNNVQKARLRHDTIQKLLESGQPLDQELLDRILAPAARRQPHLPLQPPDPRDPYRQGGMVFFLIGLVTIAIGLQRESLIALGGMVLLGLYSLWLAHTLWSRGEKDYREGRLTPPAPPRTE